MSARVDGKRALVRLAAGLVGGWLFVFGQTALGVATLAGLCHVHYDDALVLFELLAFPVFVAVFAWAFMARTAVKAWAVLAGGGALMTLVGWLLARGAH